MVKENLNDTKYNYILLRFIKLIKTVHRIKCLTYNNRDYSHKNCTTNIDYAAIAAEFQETSQIYI